MPCPPGAIPAPLVDHITSLDRGPPISKGIRFYDVPDTELCKRAEAFVHAWLPQYIANHALRTYAFALAVANYAGWDSGEKARELGFDKEVIFLACALHELGFDLDQGVKSRLSLELWGAIKAREWIMQQQDAFLEVSGRNIETLQEWADEACEAIARHTIEFRDFTSRVRLTGALVTLGAGMDLMGTCVRFVHDQDTKAICSRWPRAGYCEGLAKHAELEVGNKPACLFEDCVSAFNPGMFSIPCFEGMQGELK
ncbi:hypothetical protein EDB81DRAFT_667761 [Dactylonectria macrodidyma]|uniref:HD domain-containing protein n=1 Tax=Dactylonectria macrodidyma TaxID=307937 RepID=A0A9P9DG05_9HYPO|nr:hypothetical protein EDB81DRAFT_667761 [Dactylonectria macrodidyma]